MLFGILAGFLYLLVIPVMVAIGTLLVLFLWVPLSAGKRTLAACIAGPGLMVGPALAAPGTADAPGWAVMFGVSVFIAILAGICFPFVRIASKRLERLHPVDASVFN